MGGGGGVGKEGKKKSRRHVTDVSTAPLSAPTAAVGTRTMPPKGGGGGGKNKKEEAAKKAKAIEDKTFGLKNKNKSQKVQQFVAAMKQSAEQARARRRADTQPPLLTPHTSALRCRRAKRGASRSLTPTARRRRRRRRRMRSDTSASWPRSSSPSSRSRRWRQARRLRRGAVCSSRGGALLNALAASLEAPLTSPAASAGQASTPSPCCASSSARGRAQRASRRVASRRR